MKIVFFTRKGFESNELFLYMYARVAGRFADCSIVAVHPPAQRRSLASRLKRYWKKAHQLGLRETLEIASSYPLQIYYSRRDQRERDILLRHLPRPAVPVSSATVVSTVNGSDAVAALRSLNPDILIQAGAGILRPQIFGLSRIASLNLHHGIAPLIRGMNSIYWGLWENRPEWIGSTVHEIDQDIDTGNVLAYAPVQQRQPDEGFPALFVRATEQGVDRLLEVLSRLERGERWKTPPLAGESAFRSTISGWKLTALAWRLRSRRNLCAREARGQAARS
jgi:methionyl-tRNA formyltransferase